MAGQEDSRVIKFTKESDWISLKRGRIRDKPVWHNKIFQKHHAYMTNPDIMTTSPPTAPPSP